MKLHHFNPFRRVSPKSPAPCFLLARFLKQFLLVGLLWGASTDFFTDIGYASDTAESGLLKALGSLNYVGMGEGAGSHGSRGLSLGTGVSQHALGQLSLFERGDLGFETHESVERPFQRLLVLPRLWMVKGLPLPVDVGVTFGTSQAPILQQGSGYLQWTIFEDLGLPALSLRVIHSRIFAAKDTSLISNQVGIAASWDFLRFFSVFGSANGVHHSGVSRLFQARESNATHTEPAALRPVPLSATPEVAQPTRSEWNESTLAMGLRISILPPFFSLSGEWIQRGGEVASVVAKVAIGL